MSDVATVLPTTTGFDHVGPSAPDQPEVGTTWFDTDADPATWKVYDGSTWQEDSLAGAGTALSLSGGSYNVELTSDFTTSGGALALNVDTGTSADGPTERTNVSENTPYQNTSGSLKFIYVHAYDGDQTPNAILKISPDDGTYMTVAKSSPSGNGGDAFAAGFVPDGFYWQFGVGFENGFKIHEQVIN